MPKTRVNGAELHYVDEGAGAGAQAILFLHGLLWSGEMFRAQIDALKGTHRCIALDWRGQGQSEVTPDGYDMDTLYADAAALIESLGLKPCHVVGLSMGGFVGMRLAARRPELVRSLVLLETSAEPEPAENVPKYRKLNFVARWFGLGLVKNKVLPIMFGRTFLKDPARAELRETWTKRLVGNHKIGITRAVTGVIERKPILGELGAVKCPTLVMVGDEDVATVPAKAEKITGAISGAKLVRIPRAGHSSTIEEPAFVTEQLQAFLR
jgi:pimeloyl-ACP methyl ester carboxylesterase